MLRSVSTRLSGFLILLAGIWGGIIPFVGPAFHFTLGPDRTWTWTTGRLYLDVLPAAAAVLGGLILMGAGPWAAGRVGAFLALLGGIWFAVGPDLSLLWHTGGEAGAAHGSKTVQMLERLSFHTGLGVLITALAAYALPGLLSARRARRAEAARVAAGTTAPAASTAAPAAAGATTAEPGAPVATMPTAGTPITRRPITGSRGTQPAPEPVNGETVAPSGAEAPTQQVPA